MINRLDRKVKPVFMLSANKSRRRFACGGAVGDDGAGDFEDICTDA